MKASLKKAYVPVYRRPAKVPPYWTFEDILAECSRLRNVNGLPERQLANFAYWLSQAQFRRLSDGKVESPYEDNKWILPMDPKAIPRYPPKEYYDHQGKHEGDVVLIRWYATLFLSWCRDNYYYDRLGKPDEGFPLPSLYPVSRTVWGRMLAGTSVPAKKKQKVEVLLHFNWDPKVGAAPLTPKQERVYQRKLKEWDERRKMMRPVWKASKKFRKKRTSKYAGGITEGEHNALTGQ